MSEWQLLDLVLPTIKDFVALISLYMDNTIKLKLRYSKITRALKVKHHKHGFTS